ncbi:MAG: hypothetical protein ACRD5M_15450 [Candidatus Acidiferrales bacterium]
MPKPLIEMLILFGILGLGMLLVLFGTVAKNKWGINFEAVSCPRCGIKLPRMRKPGSARQVLWGGYTCSGCGAEVDKWGREEVIREGWWSDFINRPGSALPLNLAVGAIFFAVILWNVYDDPGGFIIVGIIALAVSSWVLKSLKSGRFF